MEATEAAKTDLLDHPFCPECEMRLRKIIADAVRLVNRELDAAPDPNFEPDMEFLIECVRFFRKEQVEVGTPENL